MEKEQIVISCRDSRMFPLGSVYLIADTVGCTQGQDDRCVACKYKICIKLEGVHGQFTYWCADRFELIAEEEEKC